MTTEQVTGTTALDPMFTAIERGDVDAVAACWSEDVRVWHVGDPEPLGKAEALRVIRWLVRTTTQRRYTEVRRDDLPGGYVQQHVLTGTTTGGRTFSAEVCIVVRRGADGLVERVDEYFDPSRFAALLADGR